MKSNSYFTLANGVQIPAIGFGTWQIPSGEVAYHSVREALKAGYRHIDTAQAYGNEADVGRAVLDSGIHAVRFLLHQNCLQRSRVMKRPCAGLNSP